jgi:hypothetical protein
MKRSILFLGPALLGLAVFTSAHARLIVTVEDLNTTATNIFTDLDYGIAGATVLNTQGIVAFTSATSPILGTYWAGSAMVNLSNYPDVTDPATLGTASFNLNALAVGDNVAINVFADEYMNPTGAPIGFESVVNASTLVDTSYDFLTQVNGILPFLLSALNVADTGTYQASAVYDVTAPFSISHALRLGASAIGGDLGVDMSSRAFAVTEPAPLALAGLGLMAIGFIRRRLA